jgi:4-amino-4-deoxy-L-arabinose transferase-like glycosyltransferase
VQLNAGASPLPYLFQHVFSSWFGYSSFAARFPAALCSILSGAVFAAICPRFLDRGCWIALVLFLVLPLQLRYGLEGRVYSQGLLFSLLTLLARG